MVVFECDADRFSIDVVLLVAAHVTVVMDVIGLDENVTRLDRFGIPRSNKQPVAVVIDLAVANGDVFTSLDVDPGHIRQVRRGGSPRPHDRIAQVGIANLQAADFDVSRFVPPCVGGIGADRHQSARRNPGVDVVEIRTLHGALTINDGAFAIRSRYTHNPNRGFRGAHTRDLDQFVIGCRAIMDLDRIARLQSAPRDSSQAGVAQTRTDFICGQQPARFQLFDLGATAKDRAPGARSGCGCRPVPQV